MKENLITISTVVHAPLEVAWNAWTQPEHITRWTFASDDWECPEASNELRVGGLFATTMRAKDRSVEFVFGGEHKDVQTHQRIESEMGDGRYMLVEFEAISSTETKVTESFEPESQNPREMQQGGWQAILENYRKHAESLNA
jgi:uncharacterized protein YndB with AHSA1/START domain